MVTLSNVELLKRVALFNSLSVSQAQLLLSATEKKRYKRNECIVEEGTKSNKLFVILSGTARVTLNTGNGRELSLALIQTGEFFGEMSLLDGQAHSATVVADTIVDALVLEQKEFNHCLLQNGALALGVLRYMVARLRKANQKISDLATVSVYGRVARQLIEIGVPMPSDDKKIIIKKVSKTQLAKDVGASREMVAKALKQFEAQGFIKMLDNGSMLLEDRRDVTSRNSKFTSHRRNGVEE